MNTCSHIRNTATSVDFPVLGFKARLHVKSTSELRVSTIEITQCAFSQERWRRKGKWCALWEDYLKPADSLGENLIVIEFIILSVHPINNKSELYWITWPLLHKPIEGESLKLNRWNWMDLGSGNWNLMDSLSPLGYWFVSDPGDEKSLFYNGCLVVFCVMSCWLPSIPQWTGVCLPSQITIPLVSHIRGQGLNRNWGWNTFLFWWVQAFLCWLTWVKKTKTALVTVHARPIFYVRGFYCLGLLS